MSVCVYAPVDEESTKGKYEMGTGAWQKWRHERGGQRGGWNKKEVCEQGELEASAMVTPQGELTEGGCQGYRYVDGPDMKTSILETK